MIRGINKQRIFYDEMDCRKFLKVLKENKKRNNYCLLAYCLMPNHVHFLIFDPERNLSNIMSGIEISYASFFNKKYQRIGNVFQDRFKSKCVDESGYFERVIRYIHQNPEKAKICKTEEYKWSSFSEYTIFGDIIDYKKCFELLGYKDRAQKECLKKFIDFNTIKSYNYEEEVECEFENSLCDSDAEEVMLDVLYRNGIYDVSTMEKRIRDKYIHKLKKMKYIKNDQIANFFNLSVKTIRNIN